MASLVIIVRSEMGVQRVVRTELVHMVHPTVVRTELVHMVHPTVVKTGPAQQNTDQCRQPSFRILRTSTGIFSSLNGNAAKFGGIFSFSVDQNTMQTSV